MTATIHPLHSPKWRKPAGQIVWFCVGPKTVRHGPKGPEPSPTVLKVAIPWPKPGEGLAVR